MVEVFLNQTLKVFTHGESKNNKGKHASMYMKCVDVQISVLNIVLICWCVYFDRV